PTRTLSSHHLFSFYCYAHRRHLHSFPTRRSSDLRLCRPAGLLPLDALHAAVRLRPPQQAQERLGFRPLERDHVHAVVRRPGLPRSEEHTSELQSRGHLVCRLLLEKKNAERRTSAS